jgi:hypothetical protein
MVLRKALVLILAATAISGCRHPLEIFGEGDIKSASGNRDCLLEQFLAADPQCTENSVQDEAYIETYTGEPRLGWVFKGWKTYCEYSNASPSCSFSESADQVEKHKNATLFPLKAEFVRDCAGDPTCTVSLDPILGAVTDTSIKIWSATWSPTSSDAIFKVRYRISGDLTWNENLPVSFNAASGFAGTIELTGLDPGTLYEYETLLNNVIPANGTGTFSTLPATGFTGQVRFGMGTDFAHAAQPFLALGQAATKNFDFMLMIGDLMYSDLPPAVTNNSAAYRGRYWNTWNDANFSALSTTTPMFMMWDDHEISDDFYPGRETEDRYPAARAAYDSYVHTHNPDTALDVTPPTGTSGNVLYYSFSVPGADFFVLDTRSYRSPNSAVDDENKTMLGDEQLNALLGYLNAQQSSSTAAFKFIVSTVPFSLGEASDDTWNSYRTEREFILSEIERLGITNVAFLSGDRHFSGVFRIISPGGYVYYDFLPSPTGTNTRPAPVGNAHPGEEEIVYISSIYRMFGDFEIDLSETKPTLRAAFVDETGVDRCVINIENDETGVMAGPPLAACEPPPGPGC